MKKKTHGGARDGSGRKKAEPTTTKRIPNSLIPRVDRLIERHKLKAKKNQELIKYGDDF